MRYLSQSGVYKLMPSQPNDLLTRRLPRYTSYPTAPHFHDGIGAQDYRAWLAALDPAASVSLYLHTPFCHELCWFCGCNTRVLRRKGVIADYLDHLIAEIDLVAEALPGRLPISHIHLGGGSPNTLGHDGLIRLIKHLRQQFDINVESEIAIELDPRSSDDDFIAACADAGISRASLGVQDLNPAVQKAINRIQPYEQVAHVVDRLKAAGIQDINVDLMYGLPHQTVPDLLTSTEQVRQLRPSRIALFGYAHVPWMKAHQALIDEALLPSPAERRLQHDSVSTQLVNSGYQAIGMDHFARRGTTMADNHAAGTLRRNFQGYTTDPATTLLGFGASAIGMTPQGYVQNETDVRRWRSSIEDRMLPIVKGIATDADDHVRRALIERLMCDMTVDIDQTATQFGYSIKDFAEEVDSLHQLRRDGLIDFENGFVRIPPKNHVLVRIVASVFDRYLRTTATAAKHATAV